MKSWKTSLGGIISAIGGAAALYPNPLINKIGIALLAIGTALTGVAARDNGVPSSAVPKAADTDAKIKGDTALFTKPNPS